MKHIFIFFIAYSIFSVTAQNYGHILNYPKPDLLWNITSTRSYAGGTASGLISVRLGSGNTKITKPVIFVEGIDFSLSEHSLFQDGSLTLSQYGTVGWPVFASGDNMKLLDGNNTERFYPQLDKVPQLLQQLYTKGYDVIFLD